MSHRKAAAGSKADHDRRATACDTRAASIPTYIGLRVDRLGPSVTKVRTDVTSIGSTVVRWRRNSRRLNPINQTDAAAKGMLEATERLVGRASPPRTCWTTAAPENRTTGGTRTLTILLPCIRRPELHRISPVAWLLALRTVRFGLHPLTRAASHECTRVMPINARPCSLATLTSQECQPLHPQGRDQRGPRGTRSPDVSTSGLAHGRTDHRTATPPLPLGRPCAPG